MKTVYCPVTGGQVNGDTCLEITLVADQYVKPAILPDKIKWSKEMRQKCLNCKWHDDLGENETVEERLNGV